MRFLCAALLVAACAREAAIDAPKGADMQKDEIPAGSGDYSAVLAIARRYQAKEISFDELQAQIAAKSLPPHKLGDGYLMIPVPAPPPGSKFDARIMPMDWQRTWGEVAMAFWLGALTREEYDRLHTALHPDCPQRRR